ncbi:hypothetical protein L1887_23804 [Cichorium endivia]|nr:hypothetical protein L1887_23804 [Cichorium endivia]
MEFLAFGHGVEAGGRILPFGRVEGVERASGGNCFLPNWLTHPETEDLSIQLKCAKMDASEKDMVSITKSTTLEGIEQDLNIINESFIGVVDKVLECREFSCGVNKLRDACLIDAEAADQGHVKKDLRDGKSLEEDEEESTSVDYVASCG